MKPAQLLLLSLLLLCTRLATATPVMHHQLDVRINPTRGEIEVDDRITLPVPARTVEFLLHAEMEIITPPNVGTLTTLGEIDGGVPIRRYRLAATRPFDHIAIAYRGTIHQPLRQLSEGYGGGRQVTAGQIGPEGVFLSLSSYWYPAIGELPVTFAMEVRLPPGWHAISQGEEDTDGRWSETNPQDDIYLIAGPYHRYTRQGAIAEAQVYLRQPAPTQAEPYLDATHEYLDLYTRLIGPYPYAKFALVENFWESGYGMPSFTLLGPRVIRLPFIIHTSYPHEILHNWWGNGVYIDYRNGNWGEGLTAYLADHLLKERAGAGHHYRRDALRGYADYVSSAEDFPIRRFRGNHGQISQAVGYGKTLMFFHMLRQRLGDRVFVEGLRRFYRDNRFQMAGFEQLRTAFEAAGATPLGAMFDQWIERTGAPALAVDQLTVKALDERFQIHGRLRQTQAEAPYQLYVPVYIETEGDETARRHIVVTTGRDTPFELTLPNRPVRISIDPLFDLFRQLDPSEQPSRLGQLFGADRLRIILPADAPGNIRRAYRRLAEGWAARHEGITIAMDIELEAIPADQAVWIFGAENRFAGLFAPHLERDGFNIDATNYTLADFAGAVTLKHPDDQRLAIGLLTLRDSDHLAGLAKKLPHYSKYSYVLFDARSLVNAAKGQWLESTSKLNIILSNNKELGEIKLEPRKPLTALLTPREADPMDQFKPRGRD
ncbi:MAG: M1 family metallopeptidase [gamma proteobacterium symbiont of Phacoides pectinatus]